MRVPLGSCVKLKFITMKINDEHKLVKRKMTYANEVNVVGDFLVSVHSHGEFVPEILWR